VSENAGPRGRSAGGALLLFGFALTLLGASLAGCGSRESANGSESGAGRDTAAEASSSDTAVVGVPVEITKVSLATLPVWIGGPGRTTVLSQQRIRAPFTGVLTAVSVLPGDRVHKGEPLGTIVEQASAAALAGAQSMMSSARTAAEREDARRALDVARQNLIGVSLTGPEDGIVVSRSGNPGERLAEGDEIAAIANLGSLAFMAEISQADAERIRPGQDARMRIVGAQAWIPGTVQAVLPADSSAGLTIRVRIAVPPSAVGSAMPVALGLFGTAEIMVGRAVDVPTVPIEAVLRDDIAGTTRLALVGPGDRARWIDVEPGMSDSGRVEILRPRLSPGQRVIVSGQVGLPDSARVVASSAP
jgi:multidrug efflux pump subunit AcrA (membrane-fusion protein)